MTNRPLDDDFNEDAMFSGQPLPQHSGHASALPPHMAQERRIQQPMQAPQMPVHSQGAMPPHMAAQQALPPSYQAPQAPVSYQAPPRMEMPQGMNPLARYFRMPGLHINLPTGGAYMPEGSIELTLSGDLPVLPMRAADELLLKNPDALMSGYALEKLIESCVPAIKLPRQISAPDLDVILLAIRAATYGENMPLTVNCPHCEEENEFECHIPNVLGTMQAISADNVVRLGDGLMVHVRPHTLDTATRMALASYEEARKLQSLDLDSDKMPAETRSKHLSQTMERVSRLNLEMLSVCIVKIEAPGAVVTDRHAIAEFIMNVPKPWVEQIDDKVKALGQGGIDRKIGVSCHECSHEWQAEVEFDPANFFDGGSSR